MPRRKRPPESACRLMAVIAAQAGVRACICMMPVPPLIFVVRANSHDTVVTARRPRLRWSRRNRSRGAQPQARNRGRGAARAPWSAARYRASSIPSPMLCRVSSSAKADDPVNTSLSNKPAMAVFAGCPPSGHDELKFRQHRLSPSPASRSARSRRSTSSRPAGETDICPCRDISSPVNRCDRRRRSR